MEQPQIYANDIGWVAHLFVVVFPCPRSNSFSSLALSTSKNPEVAAKYLVPAALYCAYNNLSYAGLAAFDPTTYFIFMQSRETAVSI